MGLDSAIGINSERHRHQNWTKYDPKGLVGHWRFCSKLPSLNLFTDVAGTTPVNADGERIGRVINEAPGDQYGNKLGQFLRVLRDTDDHKPVFKVPTGDDCCGWAEFDNTDADTKEGFIGGTLQSEDATDWGGVTSTKFSDLIMTSHTYTMFAVVKPDPSADTNTKSFYYQRGAKTSGDTTDYTIFSGQRNSDEEYNQGYNCPSCTPTNESLLTAPFADTDIHLITSKGRSGTNGASIAVDQVVFDAETLDVAYNMDFDSQGDQSNVLVPGGAFVSIGLQMAQGNVADAALALGFKGRIYEIMVYVGEMSTNYISEIEEFLMKKYCIEPTNPADGKGLVGHWDFTKKIPSSNLTQNVDGTTPVASDGDPIGYAKNFALGETTTGYKLGDFVRASANDATRPTFGTGGQNNHSYANYGAGDTIGLRAGYFTSGDSDDDGGVSATKFSDLTMSSQNFTAWYVVDNIAATGSSARILDLKGYGQADTDLGQFILARGTAGTGGDAVLRQLWRDDGFTGSPPYSQYVQNNGENPMADGFKIIAVIGDSGPGASRMFINGTEVYNITQSNDYDITFDKSSDTGTGAPRVGLGCTTNDAGIVDYGWEGRLYEVMVYKGTLSGADFSNVQTFLENKYNVTQEPVLPTISEFVGHWDFTTTIDPSTGSSNMTVNRDGTGGQPSNGDYIGKVMNQAPGDASGDKLGSFVRSFADDTSRPIFQTGGVNGKSYAHFDGSQYLRAGYFTSADCDDDGGETATKFSDLLLNNFSTTTFLVLHHDAAAGDNSGSSVAFYVKGEDQSGSPYNLARLRIARVFDPISCWTYSQADGSATVAGTYPFVGVSLVMFKNAPGATGTQLFEDGSWVNTTGDAAFTAGKKIYLNRNATGSSYVSIGENSINAAGYGTATNNWVGKIYEIIVYNKVLSDDEIDSVNNYIAAKYGISIG